MHCEQCGKRADGDSGQCLGRQCQSTANAANPPPILRLTPERIAALLQVLGEHLVAGGHQIQVVVVGGAAMALGVNPLRGATIDIDVFVTQRSVLDQVATQIAAREGLPSGWLNSAAQAFKSPVADHAQLPVVFEQGDVRIRRLDDRSLLAMKLRSGRANKDFGDIEALVKALNVKDIAEAQVVLDDYYNGEEGMKPTARIFLEALFSSD